MKPVSKKPSYFSKTREAAAGRARRDNAKTNISPASVPKVSTARAGRLSGAAQRVKYRAANPAKSKVDVARSVASAGVSAAKGALSKTKDAAKGVAMKSVMAVPSAHMALDSAKPAAKAVAGGVGRAAVATGSAVRNAATSAARTAKAGVTGVDKSLHRNSFRTYGADK